MKKFYLFIQVGLLLFISIVLTILTGCNGLPTLEPTQQPTLTPPATEQPTLEPTEQPTLQPTLSGVGNVTIMGNVWLRAGDNTQTGVLLAGTKVLAVCEGDWCAVEGGLRFWRGCSDNNPGNLTCRMEE